MSTLISELYGLDGQQEEMKGFFWPMVDMAWNEV